MTGVKEHIELTSPEYQAIAYLGVGEVLRTALPLKSHERLQKAGYLDRYRRTRTHKPIPDFKFRQPKQGSFWPYTLPHHWDVIWRSHISEMNRVNQLFMESKYENTESSSGVAYKVRMRDAAIIDRKYPRIATRSYLKSLRKAVERLFLEGHHDWHRYKWLSSPEVLRHLLVILMVRPVPDGHGGVRMEPLEHEDQMKEWDFVKSRHRPDIREGAVKLIEREPQRDAWRYRMVGEAA